jgi:hypothetical protein
MVDVRVRKNHGVQIRRIVKEGFVLVTRFGSMALEESTVEQDGQVPAFNQVLTARDLSGSAAECDLHRTAIRPLL